jgi:hypothetical protein
MSRLWLAPALAILAATAVMTAQSPPVADADVLKGIGLVKAGDHEQALLALDLAIKNLARREPKSADIAVGHLYMGVAYVGLNQDVLAKASFKQALRQDRSLRLDPKEHPARVISTFESARKASLLKPAGIIGAIGGGALAVISAAVGGAASSGGDTTTTTTITTTTSTTLITTTTLTCGDRTPPQVALTAPFPAATVAGAVALRAAASDDVAVTEVRFLVDERLVGVAPAPLFEIPWDSRNVSNGMHGVTARAFDACGNQGFSAPVTVFVAN